MRVIVLMIQVVGDPINLEFTKLCRNLGWEGEGTEYDMLPCVLGLCSSEEKSYMFEWPQEILCEIPITHPTLKGLDQLHLRWLVYFL